MVVSSHGNTRSAFRHCTQARTGATERRWEEETGLKRDTNAHTGGEKEK